jgi:DNA-binding IclR family transcriptional regulator
VLTAAQQQVLNSINPNEQLNRAQITARTGMAAANIARTLPALKNKGYLQSSGRGQNATFWKVQQPLAQAV